MKNLTPFAVFFLLLIAGCSQKELGREEAFRMIKQQEGFPKSIDYDVYRSDPAYAQKAIDAGLEKQGLVTIQQTQKLANVGEPLIQFTEKAAPYLLATPDKEKTLDVQKVKIAEEDLVEITGIRPENDGRDVLVKYTTTYKNKTPFSALMPAEFGNKRMERKARFTLNGSSWQFQK